jgi:hypothetical protein
MFFRREALVASMEEGYFPQGVASRARQKEKRRRRDNKSKKTALL